MPRRLVAIGVRKRSVVGCRLSVVGGSGRAGALPLSLLSRRKSSAPHPAEPELPSARAELRALRSAARSAAASGGWKLCSMRGGALLLLLHPVGLTRRGPPTCRHRREWLRHGECAKGRVQPPGEPVNVRRMLETKRDDPTFLGLHVLISFACALGESALPFMGETPTEGQPHLFHRQPTSHLFPSTIKI